MAIITPYLTFNGNCEEAFTFYKSVFGTEFETKMKFSDAPPSEHSKGMEDKIMHISLPVGKGSHLLGSDRPEQYGKGTFGDNFSISITVQSKEEADKIFKGLSTGGTVTMPMGDTFWGAYFGMLTDKYKVQWMISTEHK